MNFTELHNCKLFALYRVNNNSEIVISMFHRILNSYDLPQKYFITSLVVSAASQVLQLILLQTQLPALDSSVHDFQLYVNEYFDLSSTHRLIPPTTNVPVL